MLVSQKSASEYFSASVSDCCHGKANHAGGKIFYNLKKFKQKDIFLAGASDARADEAPDESPRGSHDACAAHHHHQAAPP